MSILFRKIKTFLNLFFCYIFSIKGAGKAIFLSAEQTVKNSLTEKKSIIRLGDGEFNILSKKNVHYQSYSADLENDLRRLIDDYLTSQNQVNYILAMPSKFISKNGLHLLKNKNHVFSWSRARYMFNKYYDFEIEYGDSFMFSKSNESIFKKLWSNFTHVIFVHNDEIYAEYFKEKYDKKVTFIKVPPSNAYKNRNEILSNILSEVSFINEKPIILISAGPCAKYLVYELAKRDVYSIDTGHCWDDPLK